LCLCVEFPPENYFWKTADFSGKLPAQLFMDVRLPKLGEGADSGVVVNLFVKEGQQIARNQPVLELENEKAVATIPSPAAGIVTKVYVKTGEKINVGQRLFAVAESGKAETPAKPAAKGASPMATTQSMEPEAAEASVEESPAEGTGESESVSTAAPAASPAIRKIARDLGVDLRRVRGTARGGRIVMADLRAYIQRLQSRQAGDQPKGAPAPTAAKPAPPQIDFSRWGSIVRKPLSPLRQVIARRMTENWNTIPHVTQFDEADITGLLALRKKYVGAYEKKGARLTVTSFVLRAVVDTLKKHPVFNSSLDEAAQEIVFKDYYHVGIAVDTEAGLIVPVLRDADKKDLVQLSKELEQLAAKARDRKVSSEELKGGTFTISNQGGIGGAQFTPIINKPETAILGLGRGAMKAVVREGRIEGRMILPLALSYDHRVIDGAAAARFIMDLVAALQDFKEEWVRL
jgi:pyruvate dehydrogenase E2 component (dihydrolipoamide acetyltransferase)